MCNHSDPFGLCPPADNDYSTCNNSLIQAAVQLGRSAPAMNEAVGSFIPNNLVAAIGGSLVGKAAGALFGSLGTSSVAHFTSVEGAAAIEGSGGLRAGSFVALPGEVAGRTASQVESLLEIGPGKGAMRATFKVSSDALRIPFNGPTTSGGATQFQTTRLIPLPPGSFTPVPE